MLSCSNDDSEDEMYSAVSDVTMLDTEGKFF